MDKSPNAGWVEQTAAETGQASKTLNPHFITEAEGWENIQAI